MAWVKAYERSGLLWLLPCVGSTRRPLLFLRPGYSESRPAPGVSALLEALEHSFPGARFHFWRTGRGRVVPVVMDTGGERVGFFVHETAFPRRRDLRTLKIARERGIIQRGFLLHAGKDAHYSGAAVVSLPVRTFLQEPQPWILECRTEWDSRRRVGRANRERWKAPAEYEPAQRPRVSASFFISKSSGCSPSDLQAIRPRASMM